MNNFRNRKGPLDKAPDWTESTYGQRVAMCITCLHLFEFITTLEADRIHERANDWFNKRESEVREAILEDSQSLWKNET